MTSKIHRVLMGVGGLIAGLAGLTGGSELIDPQVGAWIAFVGGLCILIANQIRVTWPDTPSVP
mgnify:CR=1 FL=1